MLMRPASLSLLIVLCVSCGESDESSEGGNPTPGPSGASALGAPLAGVPRIAVAAKEAPGKPGDIRIGVGRSATLANVNGCVGEAAKGGGATPSVLIWPHGTTITSDAEIKLRGRTFRIGDTIVFGHSGLPGPSLDQFDIPDSCKSASSVLISADDVVTLAGE